MKKKVAIVGKAATAAFAPYDDPEWDIWGLAWVKYPRLDLMFDVHHRDFKAAAHLRTHFNSHHNPEYFPAVNDGEKRAGIPVMCMAENIGPTRFKLGIPYPLEEIKAFLPRAYLECTMSYMLALAIMREYEQIGLWGCHFRSREEFLWQVPSVAWLIGVAEGRGITVDLVPGQPLLTSAYVEGRYGVTPEVRWDGGHISRKEKELEVG
jgi:hypothetical protein